MSPTIKNISIVRSVGVFLGVSSKTRAYKKSAKPYESGGIIALKIFIAGPLFSQAEREFNLKLDRYLRKHGFKTFLPQRDAGVLHELMLRHGKRAYRMVYERDLEGLERSDVVIALLDGPDVDSGTAYEIGYARARGKPVIGLKTDLRTFAKGEELNIMVAQGLHALARDLNELLAELQKLKR